MTADVRTGRSLPGIIALGIVLALLAFTAGCTQQAAPQPVSGMANPASVACGEAGGSLEIKTDATGGQYGMCTFPNGTSCEEWALYRGEGCKPGVEAAAPTKTAAMSGMANPASVACGEAGGSLEIKTDATGGQYGMCTFPNGTSCEEWALYRGEGCKPGVPAAPEGKKMVTFTDADNKKTVTVTQGTKFAVELAENPTTGFQWQATLSPGLELVSDEYQTDAHAEGMVGVGGTRTWIILAKDGGNQTFSATYKRSWETPTGSETAYSVTVSVEKA